MPTWETASDWDSNQSESNVVHESVAGTDHDDATQVKLGYQIASPYKSADLVLYAPMHEDTVGTINDFSGNNNDGTLNDATIDPGGLLGTSCYSFDGTSSNYGTFPDHAALDLGGSGTLSIWFKTTVSASNISSNKFGYNGDADQPARHSFMINSTGATTDMGFRDSTDALIGGSLISGNALNDGAWHMATLTYDGTDLVLYEDGSPVNSVTDSGKTIANITNTSYLAKHPSAGGTEFPGELAELRLYNVAFTDVEVQTLYSIGNGKFTSSAKTL